MASTLPSYCYASGFERDRQAKTEFDTLAIAYSLPSVAFCKRPSEVLVENSSIRPDVAKVAILGYN
ncbi:hypothetical protein CS8_091140 [Cupriavidus sp. 8B]